jgi:hypothetical protein
MGRTPCFDETAGSSIPAKATAAKTEQQAHVTENHSSSGTTSSAASMRKHLEEQNKDHRTWHVRTRIITSVGRGGEEVFFPMQPSHVAIRPTPYYVLHLCQDEQRRNWDCSSLEDSDWSHIEIKLSSSKAFSDDFGCRYSIHVHGIPILLHRCNRVTFSLI